MLINASLRVSEILPRVGHFPSIVYVEQRSQQHGEEGIPAEIRLSRCLRMLLSIPCSERSTYRSEQKYVGDFMLFISKYEEAKEHKSRFGR